MTPPFADVTAAVPASKGRLTGWLRRHQNKLWWAHSAYALLIGIGIMLLGSRNFTFLRLAIFHIGVIWLLSLALPRLLEHPRLPPAWAPRIRMAANFFNKNLYQQVLFFVLPIYYASATFSSSNFLFVILVALCALLATLDIIYDRHLFMRKSFTAVFFAINLFVLVNVMLPILLSISSTWTTRLSAFATAVAILSFYYPGLKRRSARFTLAAVTAIALIALVEMGRSYIPPAPLRLVAAEFGTELDRTEMRIRSPLVELAPARSLRLYALTAIRAPLGLKDRVRHRWYVNHKRVCDSPLFSMVGGRQDGFRLWTRCTIESIPANALIRVDVETEGGQLIGRARLKAATRL